MSRPRFKPIVYDLEKENHFVTKVSTNTTDDKPAIVFLRTKVRITPIESRKSYENDILELENTFDTFARNLLDFNSDYEKNYIFSIDVAEKSVKYNKTSHLRYDIFLKPKIRTELVEHKNKLKTLSDLLDKKLIELFRKYRLLWS